MSQYQRILLIADPGMKRTPAFERAAFLAKLTGASLHVSLFDRHPAIAALSLLVNRQEAEQVQNAWLGQRRAWLQEQATALQGQGLRVTTEAIWARSLRDEVLAHVRDYAPDLVVKDVAHEPALKRVLLKPLDWHLLRDCAAPVLLVNTLSKVVPRRVIAAVDVAGTPGDHQVFNAQVIRAAIGLSIQCDAELHLASCFDGLQMAGTSLAASGTPDFSGELYDALHDAYRKAFDALTVAQGVPPDRAHLLSGFPASALAALAQESHTDVLVVGTHQRHGLDRLTMGSTAEAIVDAAACDVLVVKPQALA